jgi:hypothetical protein
MCSQETRHLAIFIRNELKFINLLIYHNQQIGLLRELIFILKSERRKLYLEKHAFDERVLHGQPLNYSTNYQFVIYLHSLYDELIKFAQKLKLFWKSNSTM